jgi:hypothetical protein
VAKLPPPPRSTSGTPAKPANARDNQRGSADLAKRIEERRKQMREDAEKLRNKGGNRKPPQKPVPPKH